MGNFLFKSKEQLAAEAAAKALAKQAAYFERRRAENAERLAQEERRLEAEKQAAEARRKAEKQAAEARRQAEEQAAERRRAEQARIEAWQAQRDAHQAAENARRQAEERQSAARQRAAAIALREQREREVAEEYIFDVESEVVDYVDLYIRTRKKFDSRNPRAYRCSVGTVAQDPTVRELYNKYHDEHAAFASKYPINDFFFCDTILCLLDAVDHVLVMDNAAWSA